MNVTQPDDPGWLIGKTWGIQIWQPGRDQGGMILIKKEVVPHDPEPVGPNHVIANSGNSLGRVENEIENNKTQVEQVEATSADEGGNIL